MWRTKRTGAVYDNKCQTNLIAHEKNHKESIYAVLICFWGEQLKCNSEDSKNDKSQKKSCPSCYSNVNNVKFAGGAYLLNICFCGFHTEFHFESFIFLLKWIGRKNVSKHENMQQSLLIYFVTVSQLNDHMFESSLRQLWILEFINSLLYIICWNKRFREKI